MILFFESSRNRGLPLQRYQRSVFLYIFILSLQPSLLQFSIFWIGCFAYPLQICLFFYFFTFLQQTTNHWSLSLEFRPFPKKPPKNSNFQLHSCGMGQLVVNTSIVQPIVGFLQIIFILHYFSYAASRQQIVPKILIAADAHQQILLKISVIVGDDVFELREQRMGVTVTRKFFQFFHFRFFSFDITTTQWNVGHFFNLSPYKTRFQIHTLHTHTHTHTHKYIYKSSVL